MKYAEPMVLTKLIHQWLLNCGYNASIAPSRIHSAPQFGGDVIRLSGRSYNICVYSDGMGDECVEFYYNWPRVSIWFNHRDPGFFGKLRQELEEAKGSEKF